jgi:hypothetical protein
MSYVVATASTAIVMFAVNDVELLKRVLLTLIFGSSTPFRCQLARDPLSNPDPAIVTSSVTSPWCPDGGFAPVTVGPLVVLANVGAAGVGESMRGESHARGTRAMRARAETNIRQRIGATIHPPGVGAPVRRAW